MGASRAPLNLRLLCTCRLMAESTGAQAAEQKAAALLQAQQQAAAVAQLKARRAYTSQCVGEGSACKQQMISGKLPVHLLSCPAWQHDHHCLGLHWL